jgi:hypothetical protein
MPDAYRFQGGKDGGSGSFLCPPGHPNHDYSVYVYYARTPGDTVNVSLRSIQSVDGTATDEHAPADVRAQAQGMLDRAQLKCSEAWLRNVYGYFRNSYSPDDGNRAPEHHLGYLHVREYFPDHRPRLDLIQNPAKGYGAWPCIKCGERVQYKARKDAWCKVTSGAKWTYDDRCPKGGLHDIGNPDA